MNEVGRPLHSSMGRHHPEADAGTSANPLRREHAMKTFVILASIAAVTATASAHAVPAMHQAGGPIQQGQYCWVTTDARGSGWWDRCDTSLSIPRARSLRNRSDAEVEAIENNGGGGGGGGGGGR
jgi:hypothetical protein